MTRVELNPKYASNLHLKDVATNTYQSVSEPFLSPVDSKKLTDEIQALFKSAAIDRKRGQWKYELLFDMRGFCVSPEWECIVSDEFALAFFQFYKALSAGTRNTYQAGKDKGTNLLLGLNDGTFTINDFNKRTKEEKE